MTYVLSGTHREVFESERNRLVGLKIQFWSLCVLCGKVRLGDHLVEDGKLPLDLARKKENNSYQRALHKQCGLILAIVTACCSMIETMSGEGSGSLIAQAGHQELAAMFDISWRNV